VTATGDAKENYYKEFIARILYCKILVRFYLYKESVTRDIYYYNTNIRGT
jgi:hypothetical protein